MNFLLFSSPISRFLSYLPLVLSAGVAAYAVHTLPDKPAFALPLLVLASIVFVRPLIARWRFRRLMLSGDVPRIVSLWRAAARTSPHHEMTEPLVAATAFAAYGWVDAARMQLNRVRILGNRWQAVAEHRLFVETLLEAFDGDRQEAVRMANAIAALPLPAVSGRLRRQVVMLRTSLGALARAFARCSRAGDIELLEHVARVSPLISWSMRYAAAIVAVDAGQARRATELLQGAPAWPAESAFRGFHAELAARVQSLSSPVSSSGT